MRRVSSFVALIALAAASAAIAIAGPNPPNSEHMTAGSKSMTYKIGAPGNGICAGPVGQCGTLTLTPVGSKTQAVITIKNEPTGAIQPAMLHKGVCGHSANVAYALTDVVAGHSTTVINAPIASVAVAGDSVLIHKSAAQLNVFMACGNLSMSM